MQMFYDLFYNLENIKINIYKLPKHSKEYLGVSTFPTVMKSWLLVVIIWYHGISAVIHKNLGDFLVNILNSDRDLVFVLIGTLLLGWDKVNWFDNLSNKKVVSWQLQLFD